MEDSGRPGNTPSVLPELSGEAAARASALAHFSQGLTDEYNDRVGSALTNYEQAVRLDPHDEELHLRLAVVYLQQRRQSKAIQLIEGYVQNNKDAEKSVLLLALIYRAAEDLPKAEEMYRRILKSSPDNTEAYIELAAILIQQNRGREAAKLLKRATTKADDPTEMLRALGSVHLELAADATKEATSVKHRQAAIRAFEQVLKDQPDDMGVLYQLGNLHITNGEFGKAIDYFDAIEKENPDNLQLKGRLALAFLDGGERDIVEEKLLALADEREDPGHIYYYLGELHLENSPGIAREYFIKATQTAPSDTAPFLKLAVLTVDEDPDGAINMLIEGLEKNPSSAALAEMLAYVYFVLEQHSEAVAYFEQAKVAAEAEDIESVNPTFYFNYAIAAQKAGMADKAAELLNLTMSHNPAYLDAYLQFAFRQSDSELRKEAIDILERVGHIQPDEPNVYLYLGLLNSYLKSYQAAITAFEKAEALVQDMDLPQREEILDASFYFWYGAACEREGRYTKAENLFLKCLELNPQNSEAYNYLAYMWAEKGIKLERANDFISKALEINPGSGAYIDTLGWIYYMQGDYEQALTEINRAATLIPDDPTIIDHLGDVVFELGDVDQAIPYWKRSFILDPENDKLAEKLKWYGVDIDPLREEAARVKEKLKQAQPAPDGSQQEPPRNTPPDTLLPTLAPLPAFEMKAPTQSPDKDALVPTQ